MRELIAALLIVIALLCGFGIDAINFEKRGAIDKKLKANIAETAALRAHVHALQEQLKHVELRSEVIRRSPSPAAIRTLESIERLLNGAVKSELEK